MPARLARFALAAVAVAALLSSAPPALEQAVGSAYRGACTLAAAPLRAVRTVAFEPMPGKAAHTRVVLEHAGGGPHVAFSFDTSFLALVPTVMFLALVAASPFGLRGRLRVAAAGGALLIGYLLLRTGLLVAHAWTGHVAACELGHASFLAEPAWRRGLGALVRVLHGEPLVYSLAALVAWLVPTLWLGEHRRLLGGGPGAEGLALGRATGRRGGPTGREEAGGARPIDSGTPIHADFSAESPRMLPGSGEPADRSGRHAGARREQS